MSGTTSGAWIPYSSATLSVKAGTINLASDKLFIALLASTYSPSLTHQTWSNVSGNEVATGLGYTSGGMLLTSQAYTKSGTFSTLTAANATWPAFTATFEYGVIVRAAGAALVPTDLLVCYCDFGSGSSITGGGDTVTVTLNTGILTVGS